MQINSNNNNKQDIAKENNQISKKIENAKNLSITNSLATETNPLKKDFAILLKGSDKLKQVQSEYKKQEDIHESKTKENAAEFKAKEEKAVRDEKDGKSDSDDKSDRDQEKGVAQVQLASREIVSETTIPGARAILHTADLERIISAIRSQNVANGKQVSIELKRSVLQGLEVKLTIGKDKSISAEFIAGNETIKNQLNARAEELATVLRNRGVKLSGLKMSLSSDSDSSKDREQTDQIERIAVKNNSVQTKNIDADERFETSDTSYRI